MRKLGLVAVLITLVACVTSKLDFSDPFDFAADQHLSDALFSEKYEKRIKFDVLYAQYLIEEALSLRAKTIAFAEKLGNDTGKPLTGDELDMINIGITKHLSVRERLLGVIRKYGGWLEKENVDPKLPEHLRLKGLMLGLSSAIVLYDNYVLSIVTFEKNDRLRFLINQKDSGYAIDKNELYHMGENFHSFQNRKRLAKAVEILFEDDAHQDVRARLDATDAQYRYLSMLVEQSPSFQKFSKMGPLARFANLLGFFSRRSADSIKKVSRKVMNQISLAFGNTIGLVQSRKGKMNGKNAVRQSVKVGLQPLDILLEKTPFRLTDKFIPGYYGHVAIWTGTEAELRALDLWEHPVIKPHQAEIRSGNHVLEALRQGVVLSSLEHFLNIDDLAVLRYTDLPEAVRDGTIVRAFRQIGKDYDFNFDVESTDKIVCSELAYVTFTNVDWPTANALGRATISPDNVATMIRPKGPLELVMLYHDGNVVNGNRESTYRRFLQSSVQDLDPLQYVAR